MIGPTDAGHRGSDRAGSRTPSGTRRQKVVNSCVEPPYTLQQARLHAEPAHRRDSRCSTPQDVPRTPAGPGNGTRAHRQHPRLLRRPHAGPGGNDVVGYLATKPDLPGATAAASSRSAAFIRPSAGEVTVSQISYRIERRAAARRSSRRAASRPTRLTRGRGRARSARRPTRRPCWCSTSRPHHQLAPWLSDVQKQHPGWRRRRSCRRSTRGSCSRRCAPASTSACRADHAAGARRAVRRLVVGEQREPPGQVFAFVGAKGGVGTTTLAVNTAAALAKTAGSPALLIDLHMATATPRCCMGAEPRFSVLDALENVHRVDESFFAGLVEKTQCGVHVLGLDRARRSTWRPARRPRARCSSSRRARYRITVLDVPRTDPAMLDALDPATVHRRGHQPGAVGAARRAATVADAAPALRLAAAAAS